jgi:hypothetical protein
MDGGITMPTRYLSTCWSKISNGRRRFLRNLAIPFNPQFTDERTACLVIGEDIYTMLLSEPFFRTFTRKEIADAAKTTEVLVHYRPTVRNRSMKCSGERWRPAQKKRESQWSTSLCMAGVLRIGWSHRA